MEVQRKNNSERMIEEGELTTDSRYEITSIQTGESMAIAEVAWDDVAYIIEKDGITTMKGDAKECRKRKKMN